MPRPVRWCVSRHGCAVLPALGAWLLDLIPPKNTRPSPGETHPASVQNFTALRALRWRRNRVEIRHQLCASLRDQAFCAPTGALVRLRGPGMCGSVVASAE